MKTKIFLLAFVMFNVNVALAYTTPSVLLKYASLFDTVCSKKSDYKIEPALIKEANQKLPQWQIRWGQEGRLLLKTAMIIIGKPFPQNNYLVLLTVCNFPSMSEPLLVNIRYSLDSFTTKPISASVTISTIEHEILHTYIDSFFAKKSLLLSKYRHESATVLNHLHLFALQEASYKSLGWNNKLQNVIAKDKSLPNNDYKRVWDIVNKEGYTIFIKELQA